MYTKVEKPKENKSRAAANSVIQEKSDGKQGFGFVDNRTEIKKLSKVVEHSGSKESFSIGSRSLQRFAKGIDSEATHGNLIQCGGKSSKTNGHISKKEKVDYVIVENAILRNDTLKKSVVETETGWVLYDNEGKEIDSALQIGIINVKANELAIWTYDSIYSGMGQKLGAAITYLELLKDKYKDDDTIDGSPNTNPGSAPLFEALGIDDPKVSTVGAVRLAAEKIMHSKGWYLII